MATRVTVAIPTFRRNDHLRELIPMLLGQIDETCRASCVEARLLIVDNDPDGGAADEVARVRDPRLDYVHEPRPGLAAVRNRALTESADSRLLAFMDDDGRPEPAWLLHLVRRWQVDRPAAVAGRVLERFDSTPDPWIVAGEFFRRRSLASGTVVVAAPAGNLLLDLEAVRRLDLRFDARFGLSGGEDTLFTRQITEAGERIVWCDEAQVVDLVPDDRVARRWVLQRAWSHGNSAAAVERALCSDRRSGLLLRVRLALGGIARVVAGFVRFVAGVLTRRTRDRARGLRTAARGAGLVAGAVGHVVEEYRR